jgi:hypothetical protein
MSRAVPDGPRHNRRLAAHYDIALRDIEHVRDTRNRVAHPGETIRRTDLERAVAIIRRAERRGPASRKRRQPRTRPANRGKAAPKRSPRSKRKARFGSRALLVMLVVVAAAVILLWLSVF